MKNKIVKVSLKMLKELQKGNNIYYSDGTILCPEDKPEIPLNICLHCLGKGYLNKFDKDNDYPCFTCNGLGKVKKHIHKGARWRFNYPVCDPNCTQHKSMVTRKWEIVTCPKCLNLRKK